jgi:sirohydrochlorin cobaltochelatase
MTNDEWPTPINRVKNAIRHSSFVIRPALRFPAIPGYHSSVMDFSDAALVLLGHGSTKSVGSSLPVYLHAAELRRRRLFAEVREAFWKQEPKVAEVLKSITAPRVFIVPLFISEGYFSSDVIPRTLGFSPGNSKLKTQNSKLIYCAPIGTHDGMTDVLLTRAQGIVERFPFPRAPKPKDITLFIAGHGTKQNQDSRKAIEHQAERLRRRKEYAEVRAVFLEEEPRISACYELAPTRYVVMVPFFTSDGMHTQEDIPILLGEPKKVIQQRLAAGQPTWRNPTERKGKLLWYTPAAGTAPEIARVILERVREMAEGA